MKRTFALSLGLTLIGLTHAGAQQPDIPKIQVDQMICDFGKTSQVASVSGVFKLKNIGRALLKIEPPKPSCGCTVAALKPDSLPPGATGELSFTMNLGTYRATLEKHIAVRSNDPLTPEISLTVKADYTPLYDLSPMMLAPNLAFGVNQTNEFITITRTDGKPLPLMRLEGSKPWITATFEPQARTNETTARIRVAIQRNEPPRRFSEFVQVYAVELTNLPVSRIYLYGQIMGEVSLSPEALYWSLNADPKPPTDRPEALNTRRLTIRSADGKELQLKNPQSTIQGLKVELVPTEPGKVYELLARLDQVPASTVSGNVSFETSLAAQPRIEVPVIVNVFKP
ncbi:MAG TPA: DUF1573 domain-containing protein [Verrucomicrobiae bacterium]|nr:DUF1573 domain-containing protein [Verrucomicrobiae bacterium]